MKSATSIHFLCLIAASALGAEVAIPSFQKRAATVEMAGSLSKTKPVGEFAEQPRNPFNLNNLALAEGAPVQSAKARVVSDKSLLELLADQLNPKGTLVSPQGEPIVRLGQKMVKMGEKVALSVEGVVYEVEITSIESRKFTVRYKNEEVIRPVR